MRTVKQYRAIVGDYHFILDNPKITNVWRMPGRVRLVKSTEELELLAMRLFKALIIHAEYPTNLRAD